MEQALLEQYILGLTSEEEGKAIELYLAQNPIIAQQMIKSQGIMKEFAMEYAKQLPQKSQKDNPSTINTTLEIEPKSRSKLNISWITIILMFLIFCFALMIFLKML